LLAKNLETNKNPAMLEMGEAIKRNVENEKGALITIPGSSP
jgi:hypothetical protein